MVDCQGQLEKLNFPCAAVHNRIYSRTYLQDEQTKAVTLSTLLATG